MITDSQPVVWVPDPNLRALLPTEDYGAKQVIGSLEDWDPTEWGLKRLPVRSVLGYCRALMQSSSEARHRNQDLDSVKN